MKTPRLITAIGHLDATLISNAEGYTRKKEGLTGGWRKWGSMVACLALVLMTVLSIPLLLDGSDPAPLLPIEAAYAKGYCYQVETGDFATYVGGKVIAEERIGEHLTDVTVVAGWKNAAGEQLSSETLRAEVFTIKEVEGNVAVALRFIDQGEALTTTHYYVLLNPAADLTPVQEYVITPAFGRVTDENGATPETAPAFQ